HGLDVQAGRMSRYRQDWNFGTPTGKGARDREQAARHRLHQEGLPGTASLTGAETCEDPGDPLNQALDVSQGDRRLRRPVHVIKTVSPGHSWRLDIRRVS